jgi:hypothetical protein
MHKPSVSASGTLIVTALASVALPKMSAAASGTLTVTGTAAVSMHKPSVDIEGAPAVTGTVAAALKKMSVAAAGPGDAGPPPSSSGVVRMPKMSVSASGTLLVTASSAVSLAKMRVQATGAPVVTGTGSAALRKMSAAGTGSVVVTGVVAVTRPKMSVSAAGSELTTGAAAVRLPKMSVLANGTLIVLGSGSVSLPKMRVRADSGNTGDIAVVLPKMRVSGGNFPDHPTGPVTGTVDPGQGVTGRPDPPAGAVMTAEIAITGIMERNFVVASTVIITVPQGNTVTREFTAFDGTAAFDLTDYTIRMTIKATDTADDETGVQIDGSVIDAEGGKLAVTIPGSNVSIPGTMWHRIDAIANEDSAETTVVRGPLVIQPV